MTTAVTWAARARWGFAAMYVALLLVGIAASLFHGQAEPLVGPNDWRSEGAWFEGPPLDRSSAIPGTRRTGAIRYFRSWSADTGGVPGWIETTPFDAPTFLAVPVMGYPRAAESGIFLECLATGASRRVVTGNAHEDWAFAVYRLPWRWCEGKVRLVAVNGSKASWVGVGSPLSVPWTQWLLHAAPGTVLLHALSFVGLAGWWLLCAAFVAGLRTTLFLRSLAAIALVCFAAYTSFFTLTLVPHGRSIVSILALSGAGIGWTMLFRGVLKRPYATLIRQQLVVLFLVSLAATALLFAVDTGAGRWNAAYRYWPAMWSTDHLLPSMVATRLANGVPIMDVIGGGWKVGDRAPLQSGVLMMFLSLFRVAAGLSGEAGWMREAGLKVLGIACQSLAVVGAVALCRQLLRRRFVPTEVAAWALVLMSPFFVFNLAYTWPKLMSAGLACLGAAAFVHAAHRESSSPAFAATIGGALFGFAVLSHSGVAFGLPFVAILLNWRRPVKALTMLACAAVVALALYLPWTAWVRLLDPPGTALIKYALTGDFGHASPAEGVVANVVRVYGQMDFGTWLHSKVESVLTLFGLALHQTVSWPLLDANSGSSASSVSVLGAFRARDFLFVLPSLGILISLLAAPIVAPASRADVNRRGSEMLRRLVVAGSGGILLTLLVTLNPSILHHQSYFSVCLLYIAVVVAAGLVMPWVTALVAVAQLLYVSVVWLLDPIGYHGRLDFALLPLALAAIWMLCGAGRRSDRDGRSIRTFPHRSVLR
jgi:hypothetical protein